MVRFQLRQIVIIHVIADCSEVEVLYLTRDQYPSNRKNSSADL